MTECKNPKELLEQACEERLYTSFNELSRRDLRSLMFHLLYAMDSFDYQTSLGGIVDNMNRGFELDIPLDSDVVMVVEKVCDDRAQLDQEMLPFLSNWRLERIGVCTKLILRLAIWELQQGHTPATIVINEAVELAKCFAEKDAYRFINGVLDEYAKAKGLELTKQEEVVEK